MLFEEPVTYDLNRCPMMYETGEQVFVSLPSGETPGVIMGVHRPGYYLVTIENDALANVIVGTHRIRSLKLPMVEGED